MISPPLSKNDIALAKNEIHLIKTPGKMQIAVQAFAWLLSYEVVGTSAPTPHFLDRLYRYSGLDTSTSAHLSLTHFQVRSSIACIDKATSSPARLY